MKNKLNLHFRRFEFKYPVLRERMDRVLLRALDYMEFDENVGEKDHYIVDTEYFDSVDFACYFDKLDGLEKRKKVRIRSYAGFEGDVFFELKRKDGEVILKDRKLVGAEDYVRFLKDPFALTQEGDDFMEEFLYEFGRHGMEKKLRVRYKRRPLFSKLDHDFRVTFDNEIQVNGVGIDNFAVIEVKFNGAMPRWFHDIIEEFGLQKDTFSKYCRAVETRYGYFQ